MRGFPDGKREEGRGIVSDGASERESIFRATHEEVFVAGVAQASRLGAAGDREGHSRAEHKRVHRVARHFTVVATLRVTSTIREQTTDSCPKVEVLASFATFREIRSPQMPQTHGNGFLSQSYQFALFVFGRTDQRDVRKKNVDMIEHVVLPREISSTATMSNNPTFLT